MDVKQDKLSRLNLIIYLLGALPIIWLGLLFAPYLQGGLLDFIKNAGFIFDNPFHIKICKDSLRTVLIFLVCYVVAIGLYIS